MSYEFYRFQPRKAKQADPQADAKKSQSAKPAVAVEVKNPNHPAKGDSTKVDPIKKIKDVQLIKKQLSAKPRNSAIFILGINTNLRGVDLRKMRVGLLRHLKVGDEFNVKEQKTCKHRQININAEVHRAVHRLLETMQDPQDDDFLFQSREGKNKPLAGPYLNNLVKKWCSDANLVGNYGAHTLRKTFGYFQRVYFDVDIPTLMVLFNHGTQRQTLEYLGIQAEEVKNAYMNEI